MKIVVLAGGTSTERTVSITSGTGICKALRQKGHQAILVDIFCGIENVDRENPFPSEYDVDAASEYMSAFNDRIEQMKKERRSFFGPNVLKLCEAADIVFLGLHGANGEDGKVQATFDLMGIKYTGTGYLSSALAMDKGITKQMFLMNNVPTPRGVSMVKEEMTTDLKALGMEFPVVVKTCCGGSSVGVYIVNDQAEYEQALKDAYSYENEVVVEEYIKGREFSVAVVDGKAYPIIEIAPLQGFYDYKNKYKAGSAVETCPAELPEERKLSCLLFCPHTTTPISPFPRWPPRRMRVPRAARETAWRRNAFTAPPCIRNISSWMAGGVWQRRAAWMPAWCCGPTAALTQWRRAI